MAAAVWLKLDEDRRAFAPGETLSGRAGWALAATPTSVAVRLCWRTSGQGFQDLKVVEEVVFPAAGAQEARPFRFVLPAQPYSFSGKLISLTWTVEVVAEPGEASAHEDLVLSPGGREIALRELDPG